MITRCLIGVEGCPVGAAAELNAALASPGVISGPNVMATIRVAARIRRIFFFLSQTNERAPNLHNLRTSREDNDRVKK
jgi:hypothetical protein